MRGTEEGDGGGGSSSGEGALARGGGLGSGSEFEGVTAALLRVATAGLTAEGVDRGGIACNVGDEGGEAMICGRVEATGEFRGEPLAEFDATGVEVLFCGGLSTGTGAKV